MVRKVVVVDQDESEAAREASVKIAGAFSPTMIDALLEQAEESGTALDGPGGLLAQMTKAVLERALGAEMTAHLGYESGDPDGAGSGNSRNGSGRKTVSTVHGPVQIAVPRDEPVRFFV